MTKKSLSIAMATYNGAKYLGKQLTSLETQSVKPLELVVVDDGSNDGTEELLENFARHASFPVHIHHNEVRLGYRGNFMRAASLCVGELIAFCDQDDIWAPGKIEQAVVAFDRAGVLLFFHGASLIDPSDHLIGPASIFSRPKAVTEPLSGHSMVSPFGFSIVFDRSLLTFNDLWISSIDSNDPEHNMGHDLWFYFLSSVIGSIHYSDARLVSYRQHGANAFGWVKDTLWSKALFWLTNRSSSYASLARAAERRSQILQEVAQRSAGMQRDLATRGSAKCQDLSRLYITRERLYRSLNPFARLKLFFALKKDGAYKGSDGFTFGRNALTKDLVLGLALHPFLIKP